MNKLPSICFIIMVVLISLGSTKKRQHSAYYDMQQARGVSVEGIYISRSRRAALINGRYYVVEDMIPGRGELVAILKDRVVINEETGFEIYQMVIRRHKQ